MTEEEARHAAATFEFPGWRAKAVQAQHYRTHRMVWALEVSDNTGLSRLIESPAEWRAIYAKMQQDDKH